MLTVLLQQRSQPPKFLLVEDRGKSIPLGVVKRQPISPRSSAKLQAGLKHFVVNFPDFVLQCAEIHQMACLKRRNPNKTRGFGSVTTGHTLLNMSWTPSVLPISFSDPVCSGCMAVEIEGCHVASNFEYCN